MGARRVHGKAGILLALSAGTVLAATPPNTVITNTATASYAVAGEPVGVTGSVTVTTVGRTPSTVQFMQYVAPGAPPLGSVEAVAPAQCSTSGSVAGPFVPSSGPTPIGGSTLATPGNFRLAPTTYYGDGEPVFVKLTDLDQNRDPAVAETVIVTIKTSIGDSETLRLTETGVSTGVFIGYIQSTGARTAANDCKLSIGQDVTLSANYVDAADPSDRSVSAALVDPFGLVFDSSSGKPVNGATVMLINAATGRPATVFCDDGVTPYPATLVTGASFAACGATISEPAGRYRFPRVAPGTYQLRITPPGGYTAPSTVPNPALQALPGAPFVIVVGSRGEDFLLDPGAPVRVDMPLDPNGGDLQISKTAGKAVIGIGEFLPYALTIRNNGVAPTINTKITDRLPPGFRYRAGSVRLNDAALADPAIGADGSTLTFKIGTLAAGASVSLKYVVEVTAGARIGNAENMAMATPPMTSNTAHASVVVREDLFRSRAILMGRVIIGSCDEHVDNDEFGLANARIVLQDGRYALTDKDGRWHLDNIRPGTHVVQLDLESLPADFEVMQCQDNSRFAGRTWSQFVNVRGGTLWRADFHVRRRGDASGQPSASNAVSSSPAKVIPAKAPAQKRLQLVEQLPYNEQWVANAQPGTEWLHPGTDFHPALPAIKLAVKHDPAHVVELRVGGARVSALNHDGMLVNESRTVAVSTWRGVEIREGDNLIQLTVRDAQGKTVLEESRTIHYAAAPAKVAYVDKQSQLGADGKGRPVIAVRLVDKDGHPVRKGVSGEFEINEPYQAYSKLEALERAPLGGAVGGRPRFEVGEDGVALIELAPTTKAGEVVLGFAFNDRQRQEIRTWLTPGKRDWILVGFGEGTLGHKTFSGNMQALQDANAKEELFDHDRLAFYAKGLIKGDYLLTLAYDTGKQRGKLEPNNLKQAIDPNQSYTLYADATDPQFDAASARKLYVRIERERFYALFGDYDTGLTVTELSRYSRTVNGFKSEFKGETFAWNAFATSTSQAFVKDELQGDGTSGLYRLSRRAIVINSDKIRIETRDRFRSEVIVTSRYLTRYLDYDIDYALGTVFFREPVPVRDRGFNPVFIVADYEAGESGNEKLTYGGRAAFKPNEKLEIGATHIHEGNVGASGRLTGADATYKLDDKTTIKSEIATSERSLAGFDAEGKAWKVEALREDENLSAKVYARKLDTGFGLGQQAGAEVGTRKLGADARYKLSEAVELDGQTYRQDVLATGARREVAEGRLQWHKDALTAQGGLRIARDEDGAGKDSRSNQLLAGVAYDLFDRRLTLRANSETAFGKAGSVDFPNRYLLGADYKLTAETTLVVEQEFARGEKLSVNSTRLGLRTSPWTGAELASSLGDQSQNDSQRLFARMGLTQKLQLSDRWQADVLVDRSQTLKSNGVVPLNTNVPLASGSLFGNYSAAAVGANYSDGTWSGNGRVEWRDSDTDDKINVLMGVQRKLDEGRSAAAGLVYTRTSGVSGQERRFNGRLSFASRPWDSHWIWLDRLDLIAEKIGTGVGTGAAVLNPSGISSDARKLVNNLNVNYMPSTLTQWSFQYGAKYVLDHIDGAGYRSYTDLIGIEVRRDLGRRFDVGANASVLHSWTSKASSYGLGVSAGYRIADNTWATVGYNALGFVDKDFAGAEYRAKGVYLNMRVKFDQDTLGFNKKSILQGATALGDR